MLGAITVVKDAMGIKYYPNPATDIVTIRAKVLFTIWRFTIYMADRS
jgi:hypothetical protein